MGERGGAARPLDRKRQRDERQRRGEARPDGEGEHVDLADAFRQHIARRPERRRQNDDEERPEACPGEPLGADHRDADEGDGGADDLRPARPLAQDEPGEKDGEEHLRHDDQRRKPDRKALMDGDEQQAELADADQEAVERDRPRRRLRRGEKEHHRNGGEEEPQRGEHQRRRLADADLDGDEGQAPDDRDAHRREDVARAHVEDRRLTEASEIMRLGAITPKAVLKRPADGGRRSC